MVKARESARARRRGSQRKGKPATCARKTGHYAKGWQRQGQAEGKTDGKGKGKAKGRNGEAKEK